MIYKKKKKIIDLVTSVWGKISSTYRFDIHVMQILTLCCRSRDRWFRNAFEVSELLGMTLLDMHLQWNEHLADSNDRICDVWIFRNTKKLCYKIKLTLLSCSNHFCSTIHLSIKWLVSINSPQNGLKINRFCACSMDASISYFCPNECKTCAALRWV